MASKNNPTNRNKSSNSKGLVKHNFYAYNDARTFWGSCYAEDEEQAKSILTGQLKLNYAQKKQLKIDSI